MEVLPLSSPIYLVKHGVPPSVDALFARKAGALSHEVRDMGGTQRTAMLPTNDDLRELQIARSGRIAMELISVLAMPCIEDGTLVRLPSLGLNATELFLRYHNDEVLPRVGAFVEFALDRLQGSQAFAPSSARLAALERAATRRRCSAPKANRLLATSPAP